LLNSNVHTAAEQWREKESEHLIPIQKKINKKQ